MNRKGFTLLETVLAITLGSLVLAAALSMLVVVQRAQSAVFNRADSNSEIARVHRTMQRTFSSLMVLPTPPAGAAPAGGPTEGDAPQGAGPGQPGDPDSPDDLEAPPPEPRLVLSPDPRFPGRDLQRLEVVLSSPPIPTDPTRAAENAWADEVYELDRPADDTAGLRGAFVLAEPALDESVLTRSSGWTLWWIPREGERVQVAKNLRRLNWVVARSEEGIVERLSEYIATYTADLPDFIEVEIETTTGVRSSMMFEIAWSVGEEPELDPQTPANPGEGADNQPNGGGVGLQPGGPARSGAGGATGAGGAGGDAMTLTPPRSGSGGGNR